MKIIHVVYSLEIGGAEILVRQLCRLQNAAGHKVTVLVYSRLGPAAEGLESDGIDIVLLGEAPPWQTMWRNFKVFRRLLPDVVHCHNVAPTLQAAVSARLAGVRRVLATRHSLVSRPYDIASEIKFNLVATFCDWVAGICEVTCANLRGTPLAWPDKIVRVYNGAEAIFPAPAVQVEKRCFTLLFVGRLAPVKDLGTLLRAIAIASTKVPDLDLWIVGDGDVRADLEALTLELGIASRVRFWGQRMDTARFFQSADTFAMSSVSEGLPMSLLQAMSLGMPAVVTDVGGMAEVVKLSDCGLTAPVGDAAALGAAIVRMATEPELRGSFARNARSSYERQFTLERMNEAYLRLYR